ncbi:hypothetical protein EX30DRAFT_339130 [Ascodesmis nigricans]|uniref:Ribosomal protein S16 n=1 Tax=Ascodesmis nigricans TaxID=341454 RepID=A0A4S2N1C0_9PEZI|nr:hypothetical protein EX30DRAFT_339130 [Ascodesmis nigricans]
MVVKIRLARFGKAHQPIYNIVVAQARYGFPPSSTPPSTPPNPSPASLLLNPHPNLSLWRLYVYTKLTLPSSAPQSKPIEVIGTYDPIPHIPPGGDGKKVKDIRLDTVRAKYWLGVGAQPSDTMWRILAMFGLMEPRWGVERLKVKKQEAEKAWDEKRLKEAPLPPPTVEGEEATA